VVFFQKYDALKEGEDNEKGINRWVYRISG